MTPQLLLEAPRAVTQRRQTREAQRLAPQIQAVLDAQTDLWLSRFLRARGVFEAANPKPRLPADWLTAWTEVLGLTESQFGRVLTLAMLIGMENGGRKAIAQLGLELRFDLRNPRAVKFMRQHGAETLKAVNSVTREKIRCLLAAGVARGDSYERIGRAIRRDLKQINRARGLLIATTELGNSYEAGGQIVAADISAAGLRVEKSWLTAGDERVDQEHCQPNANAGWIPNNRNFPSGHSRPLAHPRCRCTNLYRTM